MTDRVNDRNGAWLWTSDWAKTTSKVSIAREKIVEEGECEYA